VVLLYHIMNFRWCQQCSWLYSQTDSWDLKVLIFWEIYSPKWNLRHNSVEPYHLSQILYMLTNINFLATNFMTSLILCLKFKVNLYCDAVFSRIHLLFVDASTRSNSKLSLRVTQHYIRRRFWGNDSTPNMFSSFYSLAYIRKSDTFKPKFPSFFML